MRNGILPPLQTGGVCFSVAGKCCRPLIVVDNLLSHSNFRQQLLIFANDSLLTHHCAEKIIVQSSSTKTSLYADVCANSLLCPLGAFVCLQEEFSRLSWL